MPEEKECPQCGKPMKKFSGISKTKNKPYSMWKCLSCEFVEWLKPDAYQKSAKDDEAIVNGLREIYKILLEIKEAIISYKK